CCIFPSLVPHCVALAIEVSVRRKTLNMLSGFTAGVFLATCLLDMLPSYLKGFNDAMSKTNIQVSTECLVFPLQEFIMSMGFFLALLVEQILLSYVFPLRPPAETNNFLHPDDDGPQPSPEVAHIHVDLNAHSPVRVVLLVLSLSLHSVLEGLTVGLLQKDSKILKICISILIQKCIHSFSLTLKLSQGRLHARALLVFTILFSLMSPLGIGLGVALSEITDPVHRVSHGVLDGLAAGAFLYITFLEILPHEFHHSSSEQRPIKVMILLAGYSVITAALFIKI
uniref:Solute carrier family 39 member 1 n=1 Tax=Leptobrachium leishanense TaxID=445787 RepID=A0A8C5QU44_9ANUR